MTLSKALYWELDICFLKVGPWSLTHKNSYPVFDFLAWAIQAECMACWLFKSEPFKFSFEDLKQSPNQTTTWDGIRNYQARNLIRDEIKMGDQILFYHSRITPPEIVGLAKVVKEAYPDHTSWDPQSDYYDEKSDPENPRWMMVDIQYVKDFKKPVTLTELKETSELDGLMVIRKGQRLSIQPVIQNHFDHILKMGGL